MTAGDPHATIREEHAQSGLSWWESTPADGTHAGPPPRLAAAGYGALLAQHGGDAGDEAPGPRYAVERALGAGSGGTVWAVHDARLDRTVAVKVMGRNATAPKRVLQSFLAEARIAASLNHPNVLPIHDLDITDDGDPCFVMQRIEGVALGDLLRARDEGRLPEPIAAISGIVSIFINVAQALAYAHHRQVVHQDVKPDNILIGRFGEVILVDWGCAVRGRSEAGRMSGTPIYMAPEQARSEGADVRSDVYCLGASFFHALIGRPPLPPGDDPKRFWQHKQEGVIQALSPQERRTVPPPLLAIAMKALEREPGDRYADAQAVLDDLRNYQAGLAVAALQEGLFSMLVRWSRHHQAQCWTAMVAAVLVAAMLGLYVMEKRREKAAWNVVYHDDFSDATAAAPHWRALARDSKQGPALPIADEVKIDGQDQRATVENGYLTLGSPDFVMNVVSEMVFSGDMQVEWVCHATAEGGNLNVFLGEDRLVGFTLHIAGWGDLRSCSLTRGVETVMLQQVYLPEPIRVGQILHCRLQREGATLRFWIDGKLIFDYTDIEDTMLIAPTRFGFDTWSKNRCVVDRITITTRPLPERITPLEVGKAFANAGLHERAESFFANLATAHGESSLGIEAEIRAAFSAVSHRGDLDACDRLAALADVHARHELAPYAWFAVAENRLGRGDIMGCNRAREALADYSGHPIQRRVLQSIGMEYLTAIYDEEAVKLRHIEPSRAIQAMCMAVADEVRHWSQRYGMEPMGNAFFTRLATTCIAMGRSDLPMIALPPQNQTLLQCALQSGFYDQALERWGHVPAAHTAVNEALDRFDALAQSSERLARRVALVHRGDRAAALAAKDNLAWGTICLRQNDTQAILQAEDYADKAHRYLALLREGRAEQVVGEDPEYQSEPSLLARIRLGQRDEAFQQGFLRRGIGPAVAISHWQQGDITTADRRWQILQERIPDHRSSNIVVTWRLFHALFLIEQNRRQEAMAVIDEVHALKYCNGQRSHHIAAYMLGRIEEQAFRDQPTKKDLEGDLLLAKALRAEWHGDAAAASGWWTTFADQCYQDHVTGIVLYDFARWRATRR